MSSSKPRDNAGGRPADHLSRADTGTSYSAPSESLILPGGAVGEETAEYLEEFVGTHSHHNASGVAGSAAEEIVEEEDEIARRKALPWWRRPSPWWLLCAVPFSAIVKSATLAPKVEIYTLLACRVHKPDIYHDSQIHDAFSKVVAPRAEIAGTVESDLYFPWAPIIRSNNTSLGGTEYPRLVVLAERAIGKKPKSPCAADPTVLAAVARLSAVIETTMGVLSLITTGWWGAWSDRHGRATILAVSLVGLLVSDFNFINVYHFSESLPGNYWFLMVGALLEGLLGGFSTAVAAQHAYIAETSTDATRARFLSLNLGLLFTGMTFGPVLGSLLIRNTGKTISVFYLTAIVHSIYAVLIFFGLPEPLSKRRMKASQLKYEGELRAGAEEIQSTSGGAAVVARAKRLFKFLSPLSVFMPELVDKGRNPLKRKERDWNLSLIAVAYGFTISIMASFPYIFQFANATFDWNSETLGYWLSVVGAGRAIWLTIVLPLAIKLFKPKPLIIELPAPSSSRSGAPEEEEPLLESEPNEDVSPNPPRRVKMIKKELHSPRFELGVARLSLVIDIMAYGIMVLFASQRAFGLFGVLGAMGIGYSPAVQTLLMALYARRGGTETGRLFGALSVVQALSAQILGPAGYGFVFIRTVSTYPRAIFVAGITCVTISLILMSFVRLPQDRDLEREILGAHRSGDLEEEGSAISDNSVPSRAQ
ncbi:hypothetical protein H1R20_g7121, partial [Candolleomyces eurysporus]